MLAKDDVVFRNPHILGRHNLVSRAVLHHAMLVNAGLVGKSIGPYDGLIWGNGLPDDARQLAGSAEKLARIRFEYRRDSNHGGF